MKLSSRDQMIVAGVVIALVAVAVVMLAIWPQFQALSKLDQDMQKAQSDVDAAKTLLASRQEAKAQAAETQANLTHLDNEIPDAPELPALIIELQDTANDSGVVWDKLAPSKPPATSPDGYLTMGLTFGVDGQWDDVCDYLRRLSELERGVRILTVDVTPLADTSTETTSSGAPPAVHKVHAQLSIQVYSLPRGASAAVAPGAPQ